MPLSSKELANLSQLLTSAEDKNIELALTILQAIQSKDILRGLVTELFALYKIGKETHNDTKIYSSICWQHFHQITHYLELLNDPTILEAMHSRLSVVLGFKMGTNLKKITQNTILDPTKIALIIFNKCGLGLDYLTSELPDRALRPILLQFKRGTAFSMPHKRLKKIPSLLFEFTDLEYINLNNNQIKTIPKGVEALKELRHLFIAWNPLTSVHAKLHQLPQLSFLDVAATNLRPPNLKQLQENQQLTVNCEIYPQHPHIHPPIF